MKIIRQPAFAFIILIYCTGTVRVFAQPANDNCASAINITANLNNGTCATYTTVGATDDVEGSCNNNFCAGGPGNNPNQNVWFSFTAPANGDVRIIIDGYTWGSPNYDPIVAIFTACNTANEIGCSNVNSDGTNNDSTKTVTFNGLIGATTYYFSVDAPCAVTGVFCLQVDYLDPSHCINGIMDVDETGIDCGGISCIACHCKNAVQDVDETGIDCGGADCLQCMSCTNNQTCGTATLLTFTGGPDTLSACLTDCNTGASTESWNFAGSCPNTTNQETVYYTFTTTQYYLNIFFTSTNISQPQIVLLTADCSQYYSAGCQVGAGGSVSIRNFPAGAGVTFNLMITSQSGETDTFNLCIYNYPDLSACAVSDILTAVPAPDTSGGNFQGGYAPGTTVTFCYTLNQYSKVNCQWLHGIVPIIGSGWDITSFTVTQAPVSEDGFGAWGWYSASTGNPITYNFNGTFYNTGDTVNPFGGWFYINNCGPCPNAGTDPNISWGDGQCGGPCQCDINGSGFTWSVCFQLTTPLTCVPGADLSVGIKTFADGETGGYSQTGCDVDPITYPSLASPTSICALCGIQSVTPTNILCFGDSSGSAIVSMDTTGLMPYTYVWNTLPAQTDSVTTGLTAGTYSVTVTDSTGCVDSSSVTITQPLLLAAAISGTGMVLCFSDSTGSVTVSVTGGITPYTYSWNDPGSQTGSTAIGLPAGSYIATVTDSNSCNDTASVIITQPAGALSAGITGSTDILCNGNATGNATVTASGGTTAYTYLWNDPGAQTTAVATGLTAGNYKIVVTDANGCTDSNTVTLTEPLALVLIISDTNNANCGLSDGSATVTPSGGILLYTYLWSDPLFQTDSTATGLSAASYTVTVTDGNGCAKFASVNINNIGGGTANITDTTHVLCNGDSTGSATVTPVGGLAPYTYSWNDPGLQTDSVANSVPSGTYTVTVTDNSGCIALATITITQPPALALLISSISDVGCNGDSTGSATVTAAGGVSPYTYLWNDSGIQTNATATGLPAATYKVIVTDNNNCEDSINATVNEPLTLSASITGSTNVACSGDSTGSATASTAGGAAPYTYSWNDPGAQTNSVAVGLSAGTYTVTVTDSNGCVDSVTQTITEPAPIVLSMASDSASCNGYADGSASVSLSGGLAAYNYIWSSGDSVMVTLSTTDTVNNLLAGTYTVTVTDNNGCAQTDSISINEPLDVTLSMMIDSNVSCYGGFDGGATVVLVFGVPPFNYMWTTGDTLLGTTDTSNSVTGLPAGVQAVTVSDATGCQKTIPVTITQPTAVSLTTAVNYNVSCNGGSDGSAQVGTKDTGTPPWDYIWSSGDSTMASSLNLNNVFGLSVGTYYVTVTDFNGCSEIDTVIISEPAALNLTVTSTDAACGANNGLASVSVTGGILPYYYQWDDSLSQTTDTAYNLPTGVYVVIVSDSNNCSDTAAATINNTGGATISVDSAKNVTCNGYSDGAIYITTAGGTIPYTYLWTTADTIEDLASLIGESYTVTVTDGAGCQSILDTSISEPAAILIGIVAINVSCNGATDGSATAIPTGGTPPYIYLWNDPALQTTDTAFSLSAGPYSVIVIDSNGCQNSDSVTINSSLVIATAWPDTSICLGQSVQLNASGGSSYAWSPATGLSDPLIQNPLSTATSNTNYMVVVSSPGCTADTAYANITVFPLPSAFAGADTTIPLGTGIQLNGSGGISYNWNPSSWLSCTNCQNPIANPTSTITYIMTITDANGCSNSDSITIEIDKDIVFYFPEIFSSTASDVKNKKAYVQGKGIREVKKLVIYDRWGEKIFENTNFQANEASEGWNGTRNGVLMNPAVFVYYVEVVFINDQEYTEKGDITLVH